MKLREGRDRVQWRSSLEPCCIVWSLSRVRLATPWTVALPGSSVHGIFQARILEWGAVSFSRLTYKLILFCFFICLFFGCAA